MLLVVVLVNCIKSVRELVHASTYAEICYMVLTTKSVNLPSYSYLELMVANVCTN